MTWSQLQQDCTTSFVVWSSTTRPHRLVTTDADKLYAVFQNLLSFVKRCCKSHTANKVFVMLGNNIIDIDTYIHITQTSIHHIGRYIHSGVATLPF